MSTTKLRVVGSTRFLMLSFHPLVDPLIFQSILDLCYEYLLESAFFINLLIFLKSYLTKADHSTKYCTPGEGFPISGTRSNETFGAISSKILLRWIFSAKEEHQETVSRVSKLAEEEFRCSTCQVGPYCIFCVCYYLVK